MNWKKYLPVFEWLPAYSGKTFRHDLIAGLTVAVLLVPQGMAYALLGGMPPIYGLYGGLVPLVIYGLLGTSRQLSIGAVAVPALVLLAGVSHLAEPFSEEYVSLVILAGLMIGLMQVGMGVLRLGFLANFLSRPVILGFTSAAGVIIAVSQLKYLFGFPIPRFAHLYETVGYAFGHLSEIHWPSFALCSAGIALILFFRKISRAIPGALLVTIIGVLVAAFFGLDKMGVKIVGTVPEGLPSFGLPEISKDTVMALLPTAVSVNIIGFVGSIGIAKLLESKNKDTKVMPNQELFALGAAKAVGAFFQAFPASGSFTRSVINDDAGAKTGMASIITAVLIGLTLLLFTSLFYYLPEAILAAIVLVAVKGLFDFKEARHLWHVHRQDFFMMLGTFVFTVLLGIVQGIFIGILLSLLMIIFRASKAHVAVLGRIPSTTHFRDVTRYGNAEQYEGLLIFRFDAQLFFGNVASFKETISEILEKREQKPKVFILDASCMEDIDISGLHALRDVIDNMQAMGITFQLSGAIGPVRDLLRKDGLMEKIGKENQFMNLHEAENIFHKSNHGGAAKAAGSAMKTNLNDGG